MNIECKCGCEWEVPESDKEINSILMSCPMCWKVEEQEEEIEEKEPLKEKKERKCNAPIKHTKYTDEMIDRIKEVINEKSNKEIRDMLQREFGINVSVASVAVMISKRGIKRSKSVPKTENKYEVGIVHYNENGHYMCNHAVSVNQKKLTKNTEDVTCDNCIRNLQKEPIELIDPHQKEIDEKEKRKRKGMSKEAVEIIEDNYMTKTDDELREMIADETGNFYNSERIENYRESNGMARPSGWEPMEDDDDN